MTPQKSEVRVAFRKPKRLRWVVRGLALCIGVLLIALAILGGPFLKGIAAGAFGLVGLLFAFVMVMRFMMTRRATGSATEFQPPPLPNQSWDYAMTLTDLNGTPVSAVGFRDGILVLNLWATWCMPCVAEMPSLHRLREKTADGGVRFAFVSREPLETIRPFVEKHGWTGDLYRMEGEQPAAFPMRGIPATYVIDRGGRIVLRHMGAARWDDDSVVAFLRGLAVAATL